MMITDFKYITESGLILDVSLDEGDNLFESCSKEELLNYYKSNSTGIKWLYGGKEILFFEKGQRLLGYPTLNLDRVILIYPSSHLKYGAPQNAVIYKEDGTIYMNLKVPELISPTAKERKARAKYNISEDASFRGVYWGGNSQGNKVIVVTIYFDWEWWESRVLNPETGEFGECISSGRR